VRRIGLVVQRYGASITGGSESLARAVAERLAADHDVTVLTTCAADYVTWRNELPAGESLESGVRVRRFPVAEERDLAAFNAFAEPLYVRARSREEELEFLRRQGPVAPGLLDALRSASFDAVFFFTYLYWPTWHGLLAAPQRAILVPTTHDEPPLRFSIYDELFVAARAFGFLTGPERELVERRFGTAGRPWQEAGIGIEVPASPDVEGFRIRRDVHGPYVLYAGRIDAGKGCDRMLQWHERYRTSRPGGAPLLLLGKLSMPEPRQPGVRYLGFLDEDEKHAALAGASAVICPSPYESLSIVLLEAFAHGVPVLSSQLSPVLVDHCRRSNAGLWYADADEFVEALDVLVGDDALRRALGANGRRYVAERYAWPAVMARWNALVEAVAG
jgi:glycosyltransferase involved in cell wall biosynthesis